MPQRGMRIRNPVCTKKELIAAPFLYGLDMTIRKEAAYADTGRTVMDETTGWKHAGNKRETVGYGYSTRLLEYRYLYLLVPVEKRKEMCD